MSTSEAMILAAGIGSLPAWAALAVSLHTQRRTLPQQTSELKQHIDSSSPAAETVLAWGDERGS